MDSLLSEMRAIILDRLVREYGVIRVVGDSVVERNDPGDGPHQSPLTDEAWATLALIDVEVS